MTNALRFYEKVELFPKSAVFGFVRERSGLRLRASLNAVRLRN
jgi:hypothetical protein